MNDNGDPQVTLDYVRDENGNITKISRESGRTFYYTYDRTEQLTSEIIKAPDLSTLYSFEYEYDGAGNRMRMIRDGGNTYYTYNKANELRTEFRGTEHAYFFYDGKGNTVRERQKDGFNRYYWYDADNMMTKVHYAETGERTHLYFVYNALLERVEKKNWSEAGQDNRSYAFDEASKIAVFGSDGKMDERYIHEERAFYGIGRPTVFQTSRVPSTYAYHADSTESTIALSDGQQQTSWSALYGAFGEEMASGGHPVQMLRYSSNEIDDQIAAIAYFYREYHVRSARWLERDPLRSVPGSRRYAALLNEWDPDLEKDYVFRGQNPMKYDEFIGLRTFVADVAGGIYGLAARPYFWGFERKGYKGKGRAGMIEDIARKAQDGGCIDNLVLFGHGTSGGVYGPGTFINYGVLTDKQMDKLCGALCDNAKVIMLGCSTATAEGREGKPASDKAKAQSKTYLECIAAHCGRGIRAFGLLGDIWVVGRLMIVKTPECAAPLPVPDTAFLPALLNQAGWQGVFWASEKGDPNKKKPSRPRWCHNKSG
jgi:RHS repeat-associated protein